LTYLDHYLQSTVVEYSGRRYLQKEGVCVGSAVAPILSEIYLNSLDSSVLRVLFKQLEGSKVARIFRFVDDYLVLFDCDEEGFGAEVSSVLTTFSESLEPLILTHELPVNSSIRFLDLRLDFLDTHACWVYEPRSNKPLLPFSSAHSKLVKRGIVNMCFQNALDKSCPHQVNKGFNQQESRLRSAGYPSYLLTAVAETLLKKRPSNSTSEGRQVNKKVTVVPYLHGISHNLKKVGSRVGVEVVFSAPNKLAGLCRKVNSEVENKTVSNKKHQNLFVACAQGVVYSIPLSCGRRYVGQTGRCVNDRLREHRYSVFKVVSGHLGVHCRDCGCTPAFDKCQVVFRNKDRVTREIIEARDIARLGQDCVSAPSLVLSDKERRYLER
ncbi:unnamed protein product, partial [Ixodes hexagonus]